MKVLSSLVAAAALFATTTAFAADTLRFSSFEPPVALVTKEILTPWAKDVSAASNGALNVQIFAGGSLGRDPAQQLQLVEQGVADIAWVIPGYSPGRFQEGTVAEIPFLVPDATAGSAAMWEMYEKGLFKGDFNKLKMLGVFASFPNFVAATKPVSTPADMNGLNFRAPGPTLLTAIKALGAVPIGGITGPSIADSISKGLIAGTLTQWGAVETFRMADVITHYNTVPLGATPMLVVMNKSKYDSLPKEAQEALDKFSGAAFSERFGAIFDKSMKDTRERIAANPAVTIVDPDDKLMAEWQNAVSVAKTNWIEQNPEGQQIYDAFAAAIAANKSSQ
ncbi:TRAP transporter substrate-binding protein [Oryzicola mucosus]|uniref:TRAP transporter substrate-binding protein n=1 Tax=Oryzicola mucosus TaxID=2767425 RepID=A0A8J6U3R1_9HYPH|nr:TRAP transporter substrate-binding protein [Oryzicola mucosus]MBD0417208.1 TRAP transporter substrate-binding protein [Oryzicola mucosus]